MKQVGRDDGVGDAGFIFQADKDKTFGRSGALARDDAASDAETLAARNLAQFAGTANPHGIEPGAPVGHGMRPDSEPGAAEIGNQALFMIHWWKRRGRVGLRLLFEQWAGSTHCAFDLPEGVAPVEGKVRRFRFWVLGGW